MIEITSKEKYIEYVQFLVRTSQVEFITTYKEYVAIQTQLIKDFDIKDN